MLTVSVVPVEALWAVKCIHNPPVLRKTSRRADDLSTRIPAIARIITRAGNASIQRPRARSLRRALDAAGGFWYKYSYKLYHRDWL